MGSSQPIWKHVYYKRVSKLYVVDGDAGWYELFDVPATTYEKLRAAKNQRAYFKRHLLNNFKHQRHARKQMPPVHFRIRFAKKCPRDVIEAMLNTSFLGRGSFYKRDDPRVLFLAPFRYPDPVLEELLAEMERLGHAKCVREVR